MLAKLDPKRESIFIEECRSLVSEALGDLEKAIWHRENEIRLVRRLLQLAKESSTEDVVHSAYNYSDLQERLHILAMLYGDVGDVHRAIELLQESKKLARGPTRHFRRRRTSAHVPEGSRGRHDPSSEHFREREPQTNAVFD